MSTNVNTKMNILAAIGIIGVVLIHCGYEIIDLFPRWRMPMFICLSGYFFQNKNLESIFSYIMRKFNRLIMPVAGWQLFYGCISYVLLTMGFINYGVGINFDNYLNSVFLNLGQFQCSASLWVVPCLFYVQFGYVLLKRIYIYIYINDMNLSLL